MGPDSILFKDEFADEAEICAYFSPVEMIPQEATYYPSQQFKTDIIFGEGKIIIISIPSQALSIKSTLDDNFKFDKKEACARLIQHSYRLRTRTNFLLIVGLSLRIHSLERKKSIQSGI